MVVIVRFRVPADAFGLGRTLASEDTMIELESLIPGGEQSLPFFWIRTSDPGSFLDRVRERLGEGASVAVVERVADRTLIALDWPIESDDVFRGIAGADGRILRATATEDVWEFTVRFFAHEMLSAFGEHCDERDVPIAVQRIYRATDPDDRRFGLTDRQYEAITLAVSEGYYDVPRTCTTADLADRLGISEQAVIERLRRAIVNLVENALAHERP